MYMKIVIANTNIEVLSVTRHHSEEQCENVSVLLCSQVLKGNDSVNE